MWLAPRLKRSWLLAFLRLAVFIQWKYWYRRTPVSSTFKGTARLPGSSGHSTPTDMTRQFVRKPCRRIVRTRIQKITITSSNVYYTSRHCNTVTIQGMQLQHFVVATATTIASFPGHRRNGPIPRPQEKWPSTYCHMTIQLHHTSKCSIAIACLIWFEWLLLHFHGSRELLPQVGKPRSHHWKYQVSLVPRPFFTTQGILVWWTAYSFLFPPPESWRSNQVALQKWRITRE